MDQQQESSRLIPSLSPARYILRETDSQSRLFIFCHGFNNDHKKMWQWFEPRFPKNVNLLSVAGPFPMPRLDGDSWKVGYSWFFYDNFQDYYFVDYQVCQAYLSSLIKTLGYWESPKTLIGYSQGGYATVHMAEKLKGVDHIIGMGCNFKIKEPQWQNPVTVEALHGEKDSIVECAGAQKSFANLPKRNQGRFEVFKGAEHKPTPGMLDQIVSWATSERPST